MQTDIEHDVPKALQVLVRVLVSDVFGSYIFRADSPAIYAPEDEEPALPTTPTPGGLDSHLTPIRAHAHVKTAHFASSGAFTSSIARLFSVLPQDHPARDFTIHCLHSHAKLVYPANSILS